MRILACFFIAALAAACGSSHRPSDFDAGPGSDGARDGGTTSPDGAISVDGSTTVPDGTIVGTDGGGGPECTTGDAFDMSMCRFAAAFCDYTEGCPEVAAPPPPCESALLGGLSELRSGTTDLDVCRECLDAIASAVTSFGVMGVCPLPRDPPAAVIDKCDVDPTTDSDSDGVPNNDVDACGDGLGGVGGGGGMGGEPPPDDVPPPEPHP
jgi:hypothetical protein